MEHTPEWNTPMLTSVSSSDPPRDSGSDSSSDSPSAISDPLPTVSYSLTDISDPSHATSDSSSVNGFPSQTTCNPSSSISDGQFTTIFFK